MTRPVKSKGVYKLSCFGPKVTAAFSGREFDASRRSGFLGDLGLKEENLFLVRQVHSANLVLVSEGKRPDKECGADGMLTKQRGAVLGILTADCFPVFLYDPVKGAAGIVHAGWRGQSQSIVAKSVQAFRFNFASRSEDLQAAVGPGIRACCFEVDEDFRNIFPAFYRACEDAESSGKGRVDLAGAILKDLVSEGIREEKIRDTGFCTVCHNGQFFSYRREQKTPERMLSVISLAS